MYKLLALILGGAVGTVMRYLVSSFTLKFVEGAFPWGTLIVNLLGSFFIGLCFGLFEKGELHINIKLFLFVGIFGGFTTFSSYALETLSLIKAGHIRIAISYILSSNILGILLVFIGYYMTKSWNVISH